MNVVGIQVGNSINWLAGNGQYCMNLSFCEQNFVTLVLHFRHTIPHYLCNDHGPILLLEAYWAYLYRGGCKYFTTSFLIRFALATTHRSTQTKSHRKRPCTYLYLRDILYTGQTGVPARRPIKMQILMKCNVVSVATGDSIFKVTFVASKICQKMQ